MVSILRGIQPLRRPERGESAFVPLEQWIAYLPRMTMRRDGVICEWDRRSRENSDGYWERGLIGGALSAAGRIFSADRHLDEGGPGSVNIFPENSIWPRLVT